MTTSKDDDKKNKRRILIGCVMFVVVVFFIFLTWSLLPLRVSRPALSSTKILDREGGLLYEISQPEEGSRTVISLDKIAPSFLHLLITKEDGRFYHHHGVDWFANARALKDAVQKRRIISGASTLEQQLMKRVYFSHESRSCAQKLREMTAAIYWSFTHTKEETLTAYVNTIFFGQRAYGIETASRTYFHKSAADLTFEESVFLVARIPAPSRRNKETTGVAVHEVRHEIKAPHFVFRVLDELEERYPDIRQGGYTVRTSLDPQLQQMATEVMARRLFALRDQQVGNAALVAMDPRSGEVLAYVGSRDYFLDDIQGQVDMVQAKRQPGSSLKPFLYFQAFLQGLTPSTVIADLPVRFETVEGKSYYPRNYGYTYHGPVSLRDALGSSFNIPAVKILDRVGLTAFTGILSRFGLRFPEPADHYGLGLVLGGGETSLFEVTRAYASLALQARSMEPVSVLNVAATRVSPIMPSPIYASPIKHEPLFSDQEKSEAAAYLVSDILSDKQARIRSFGESNLLEIGKRVAVKTGTTKDFRDNWVFGYTPAFVLGVWVGNADNTPMKGVSGITGAVPIWHDVMQARLSNTREVHWPRPSSMISRNICVTSGKLASDFCPKTRVDFFMGGTEPTTVDDWYIEKEIDGKKKIFLQPPEEYAPWMEAIGYEKPPERKGEKRLIIVTPLDGDVFDSVSLLDPLNATIPFVAGGEKRAQYEWSLNGEKHVSSGPTLSWRPTPGTYRLELTGSDRTISFKVQ